MQQAIDDGLQRVDDLLAKPLGGVGQPADHIKGIA
jgi:hypothetical protein